MLRTSSIRALLRALLVVIGVVVIARLPTVRRFIARHEPVWGAKATVLPRTLFATQIVAGARAQIGTIYDASYLRIPYPGGDVSPDRGACSDVVVRALRHAGVDLQQLIHEDIQNHSAAYSAANPIANPDANIDHRRCANQMCFLSRHARSLTTETDPDAHEAWQPGDLIYWQLPDGRLHVGVLSNRINSKSFPLAIHNGGVCREQDCLSNWKIVGHYRYERD